jgi:hypothetical protein
MARFILKLSFFFGIYFLVLIVPLILSSSTFNRLQLPKGGYIFLGDSRFNRSIDSPYNYALGSESPMFSFYKLKKIFKFNKINCVFLSFSEHSIAEYYDYYNNKSEIIERYIEYLPVNYKLKWIYKINLMRADNDRIKNLFKKGTMILGGYESPPSNKFFNPEFCKKRIDFQYGNGFFSNANIAYLDSIRKFCDFNKIRLVIIKTPVHPNYKNQIPQVYQLEYEKIVDKMLVWNFESLFSINDYFLPDGDHLSILGGKAFTIEVKQKVDSFLNLSLNITNKLSSTKNY